jgi:hypothetical protein
MARGRSPSHLWLRFPSDLREIDSERSVLSAFFAEEKEVDFVSVGRPSIEQKARLWMLTLALVVNLSTTRTKILGCSHESPKGDWIDFFVGHGLVLSASSRRAICT